MKWFRTGLTKETLTKEYRELAKKYHPDISSDPDAETKMKQINGEYDRYFTMMQEEITGYDVTSIWQRYENARKSREIILAFLKRDRRGNGGFFTYNEHGQVLSDDSDSWKDFHGGFALCELGKNVVASFFRGWDIDQRVKRLPNRVEFPNYAEMYFGLQFGKFESDSTAIARTDTMVGECASIDLYSTYRWIYSKYHGNIWITSEKIYRPRLHKEVQERYAYMKVDDRIMRCYFSLNPDYYTVVETFNGWDFGYIAFQDCRREEFCNCHDVDYTPVLAPALSCKLLEAKDLYWIDDPVVAHFARRGIVNFYQSEVNFKLRYGSFNSKVLDTHVHELGIEEAEQIQDFLDKLNDEFDLTSKGMARKGKLKIDTSQRSNRFYTTELFW